MTKTSEEEEPFRKPTISGRRILVGHGSSGSSSGGTNSTNSSQLSTGGGSIKNSQCQEHIQLFGYHSFHGEGSEDLEKHLFICENIWVAKKITDEDTKVSQLAITFRDRALDWYMGLAVNSPQGAYNIANVKKALINEFQ
jgi:hypothetical protein